MKRGAGVFLLLCVAFCSSGQTRYSRLSELYHFVEQADSLSFVSQKVFYLEKFLKDNYNYRETWRYSENKGKVIYFQVDFILDSTAFTEVYYINRGALVCSEEYVKINYSDWEDELRWAGVFYFEKALPQQIVTLGRRPAASNTSPEVAVADRFEKRFSELKRHIPMLPGNF